MALVPFADTDSNQECNVSRRPLRERTTSRWRRRRYAAHVTLSTTKIQFDYFTYSVELLQVRGTPSSMLVTYTDSRTSLYRGVVGCALPKCRCRLGRPALVRIRHRSVLKLRSPRHRRAH